MCPFPETTGSCVAPQTRDRGFTNNAMNNDTVDTQVFAADAEAMSPCGTWAWRSGP